MIYNNVKTEITFGYKGRSTTRLVTGHGELKDTGEKYSILLIGDLLTKKEYQPGDRLDESDELQDPREMPIKLLFFDERSIDVMIEAMTKVKENFQEIKNIDETK